MLSGLFGGVESEYPESVSGTLQRPNASRQCNTAFNAAGTLLAVGCSDGAVAIYDVETKAVAKLLKGATQPCIAVSWNRNSHHLLAAYMGGLVIRWNVLAGTQGSHAHVAQLPGENEQRNIKTIQLHPDITDLAILNFSDHDHPLLVELEPTPTPTVAPSPTPAPEGPAPVAEAEVPVRPPLWSRFISTPFQPFVPSPAPAADPSPATPSADAAAAAPSTDPSAAPAAAATPSSASLDDPQQYYSKWYSTVAIFDHTGRFVFEGNSKGSILAYQFLWDRTLRASAPPSPAQADTTSLPACAQLRLIHVESNVAPNPRSRVPISIVHGLVQSPCCSFLLCNNSSQLKVYRLEAGLMSDAPDADQARAAHSEKLLLEATTQQVVQNGALISLEVERHARMRTERERLIRAGRIRSKPTHRAALDRNGLPRSKKKRPPRNANTANEEEVEEKAAEADQPDQDLDDNAEKEAGGKEENGPVVKQEADATVKEEGDATATAAAAAVKDENEAAVKEEDEATAAKDEAAAKEEEKSDAAVIAPTTPSASPACVAGQSDGEEMDVSGDGDASSSGLTSLLEYTTTFSDQVNRVPWRKICFSHGSDFIIAGSAERGEHRIHIWSLHSGQLTKILLGPTEGLLDLATHPTRSILVTCCTSGAIYIWSKNHVENWSAFAPDFEELDDNREYVEKEDEFDIVPLDPLKSHTSIDVVVDIVALDSCDRTGDLITLPATVQADVETEAAYRTRRQRAIEAEEKRRDAEKQAIDSQPPSSPAGKRSLEEVAPSEDSPAKKAKLP